MTKRLKRSVDFMDDFIYSRILLGRAIAKKSMSFPAERSEGKGTQVGEPFQSMRLAATQRIVQHANIVQLLDLGPLPSPRSGAARRG
ncbi:MAG: hypothetical protein ACLQUZ_08940 [Rhizomicrobium sp.]